MNGLSLFMTSGAPLVRCGLEGFPTRPLWKPSPERRQVARIPTGPCVLCD